MSREFIFRIEETGLADEEGNVCFQGRCTGEEIVRCGECANGWKTIDDMVVCDKYYLDGKHPMNWFCANGEKMG